MLYWLRKIFAFGRVSNAGERGEQTAAVWLERERGFVVIARNWRNPRDRRDEIDLVCQDKDVLVFVEVKARAAGAFVPGFYAVDARKKRVLRRTIEAYLANLRPKPRTFRFDVVEVTATNARPKRALPKLSPRAEEEPISSKSLEPEVLHFENVPLFSKHFRP